MPAADAAPEAVPADAGDGPEVTSPEAAEAESDDADTPRRPRRRRGGRGRGRRTDDAEDGADAGDTPASSADTAESPAEEARPRRSRGGRGRGAAETDAAPEPASEAAAETDEAPARSRRRSRADASDAPAEPTRGRGRSARTDSETEAAPRESRATNDRGSSASGTRSQGSVPSNEQLLKRGTPVIVKITKEPISTKGSRASTDLSIAGRFLVLVPAADYVAVSKKIESAKERRRLRTLASSLKPEGFGVIVRTVAEGRDTKSLDTDMRLLVEKWRKIERKLAERPKPPVLLYEDVNMVSSIIRDLFSEDYDQIIVDDPRVFKNVQTYVRAIAPQMADNVRLHTSSTPVFRALALERQVEEAFSKRVNMKGGGYLYIETTEAMHVVDVNSGRAGRGKSQKDNLIAVNVEAAKEIAKQLRLRDLGGIIVVDFIDLRHESDRRKVTNALKEAFAKDRAVTKLLPMSDFGLVQITRQRLRPSITTAGQGEDGAADPAEAARLAGAAEIEQPERGYAVEAVAEPAAERAAAPERATDVARASTPEALTAQLRAWLDTYRKNVDAAYKDRPVVVRVHPLFAAFLRRGFPSPLTRWRLTLRGITYRIEEDAAADPLAFDVRDEKSGRTLMKKYVA
jgi:ribonuclease G